MLLARDRKRKLKRRRLNKPYKFDPNNTNFDGVALPEDLIFSEILTRLPVNSLTQFKLVSTTWNSMISSPHFIKSHVKRTISNPFVPSNCVFIRSPYYFYILNYAAYDRCPDDNRGEKGLTSVKDLRFSDNGINTFLIGSCNGLVCFGRRSTSSHIDYWFRVCNPVMGHYYDVLDPLGNYGRKLLSGFGFVSSKDDYRLFVGGLQRRCLENYVYVYSLRSKEWKKIGVFDEAEFSVFSGGKGVLVNETLHWDMTQVRSINNKYRICAFDLVTETFKYVPVPNVYGSKGNFLDFRLCEMGGSLCAWAEGVDGGLEIWMLMQYGAWDSWKKIFKIDMIPRVSKLYGCTESGKVLVQTEEGSLLLADPHHSPATYTSLVKDLGDIDVVCYFRSAVSPFL